AVAIKQELVADAQTLRLAGKDRIEDTEQAARHLPEARLTVARHVQRVRMTGPRELHGALLVVIEDIGDSNKRTFRDRLVHQVLVEAVEHFARREQAVLLTENVLGLDPFFYEDRQKAGRDAVTHRVGDVETDVLFVQPKDVVKVAADSAAEPVVHGKPDAR